MVKETTIKISKEFKLKLNQMKYDLGYKDVESIIQKMFELIKENKLLKELEKNE